MPGSPVEYVADCPYVPSYMELGNTLTLGAGLPDTCLVNYRAGTYVEPKEGALALGEVWKPYFNRQPGKFSSHAQTPVDAPVGHPVGVLSEAGNVAYLYAPIFQGYREDAFYVYRELAARMLERLLPDPLIKPISGIPASMEISVLKQADEKRLVVHLVAFTPQRRTAANEFIEDEVPVTDLKFAVKTGAVPSRVALQPRDHSIDFEMDGEYCVVHIRKVCTHLAITFEGV